MKIDSYSLADFKRLDAVRPDLARFADRLTVTSYDEFIEVLYKDLDSCISYVEEDPKVRLTDGEDRLTSELIGLLKARLYSAAHDEMIGGHSDIVVRHEKGYLWIGEAKIHSGYDYLVQGFNQLTTRYMRGTPNADKGALLIYIRNSNVAKVVESWGTKLEELKLPAYVKRDCSSRKELGFYNDHTHTASGRLVSIRHIGINLHWNPLA